jgi:phosphoribosylformylglycinamidine synthase
LIGAEIDLTVEPAPVAEGEAAKPRPRLDALLFGETHGRIVISVSSVNAGKVLAQAAILGVPALRIGRVGGDKLAVRSPHAEWSCSVTELHDRWWNSIARAMA